jgi:hypothetical protein
MPSPFPGMDPYLEGSPLWQGFHNTFLSFTLDTLQPLLPPNYVATVEVRVYVEHGDGEIRQEVPALEVVRTGVSSSRGGLPRLSPQGKWIAAVGLPIKEAYLEVKRLPGAELVTAMEVLSPSNKRKGEGRIEYLDKQTRARQGGVNLVELDLLRSGEHTLAVPAHLIECCQPFDYVACISRASRSDGYEVLAWRMRDRLPLVFLPLAPGDPEVELDLQAILDRTYNAGAYQKLLDYSRVLSPSPPNDDQRWIGDRLREASKRGGFGG